VWEASKSTNGSKVARRKSGHQEEGAAGRRGWGRGQEYLAHKKARVALGVLLVGAAVGGAAGHVYTLNPEP